MIVDTENIDEYFTIAERLQYGIRDRLAKYIEDGIFYLHTNPPRNRHNKDGTWKYEPDHILAYNGLIHIVEDKNWPRARMTPESIEQKLKKKFLNYEKAATRSLGEYMRIAVLSISHTLTEDTIDVLRFGNIYTIITPPIPEDEYAASVILDYIEESILELIEYKGRKRKGWLYVMFKE